MNSYPDMLRRRARFAPPRWPHEETASPQQERNSRALLAWRIRWAQRVSYPDIVDPQWRKAIDAWYEQRRERAQEWLHANRMRRAIRDAAKAAPSTVLTLRRPTR